MCAFGKADDITIEILEDGTIKVITDPISGANHSNAEQFLQFMGRLAGGETSRQRKGTGHQHHHGHEHDHAKAGHGH